MFFFTSGQARAYNQKHAPVQPPIKNENFEQTIVNKNIAISEGIDSIANSIDVYLTGKDVSDKPNKTVVIVGNQFSAAEGGIYKYKPTLDVRLRFPKLEKKLQLKFTSYDEDAQTRGINQNRLKDTPTENDYGASIGLFQSMGKIRTTFRPRFELSRTSYVLGFETDHSVKEHELVFFPKLELFGRSDAGTGQFGALNYSYGLSSKNTISLVNEEQYTDGDNTFSTNQGFSFSHVYTKAMSQSYGLIFESNSRPSYHLNRYVLSTTFTHQFYKNVLHYYITPYLAFNKIEDFQGSPGLIVKVDFIF